MKSKDIILRTLGNKTLTIIMLFLTVILGILFNIFSALTIRSIINDALTAEGFDSLAFYAVMFTVFIVFAFVMDILAKSQALAIGTEVSNNLAKTVFSTAIRAEDNELKRIETDEVIRIIGKDCTTIGNIYIGDNNITFIRSVLFLITVFITMMILDAILGLLTFVTLPLVYMIVKTTEKHIEKVNKSAEKQHEARCGVIKENFEKIRSIKLKNGVIYEESEFEKQSEQFFKQYRNIEVLGETVNVRLYDFFMGLALAIILGLGGYLTRRHLSSAGTIVAFFILTPYVYSNFKKALDTRFLPRNIKEEIDAIDTVLALRSELKSEPIQFLDEVHSLRFENVSYAGSDDSLNNVSFDVKKGERLGIISVSGNGRNILFNLFTKIIRPRDGIISINNCDINKINTFYLRDLVTAVPQDDTLFNDTIINNITYPLPFDEYKYNDALHKSGLKEIVSTYENKDQTGVEVLPEELLQRITLANAFYKDSKIFVFNDAASLLDARDEDKIMSEIFKLKSKIVILMTEKLYYAAKCDKLLIVENDQVLEYGKTADLLQDRSSLYSKMIRKVKKIS